MTDFTPPTPRLDASDALPPTAEPAGASPVVSSPAGTDHGVLRVQPYGAPGGYTPPVGYLNSYGPRPGVNGFAIASAVTGVTGAGIVAWLASGAAASSAALLSLFPAVILGGLAAILLPGLGIAFGHIGVSRSRFGRGGRALAVVGLVASYLAVATLLWLLFGLPAL